MWVKATIGEITRNLNKLRVPLNSAERQRKSIRKLYPYIGANNIIDYIDEYIFDERILCVAEDGGSWGPGQQCAVIYEGKTWVNNHAHVLVENGKANLDYLRHFLNRTDLTKYITGTTRGKLTRTALDRIEVPLPPLLFQIRIADTLNRAEAVISQRKESLRLLDEFLKSTFLEMFGDPVRNEKGWDKKKLEDLVAQDCPITYGIVQPGEEVPSGIPIVRPVDLVETTIARDALKRIDPKVSAKFKRTILKGNEILICVRGTTGKLAFATAQLKGCNVTRGITPIWFPDSYNSVFAFSLLDFPTINMEIQKLTYGATLKQINLRDLREIMLINPPIDLQRKYASIFATVNSIRTQYQSSLKQLTNLFGSLNQRAFRYPTNSKSLPIRITA